MFAIKPCAFVFILLTCVEPVFPQNAPTTNPAPPTSPTPSTMQAAATKPAPATRPVREGLRKRGLVVKIEGKDIYLSVAGKGEEREELVITTDENTSFTIDGQTGALDECIAGMRLTLQRSVASRRQPNPVLYVTGESPIREGFIVRIEGNMIVTKPNQSDPADKEEKFQTDDKTTFEMFRRDTKTGAVESTGKVKLDELKPGLAVRIVVGPKAAKRVMAIPPPDSK